MIYRFRAILDDTQDVFRDIEISGTSTLEDFHNILMQSFQLPGDEMASFYTCDQDWNQNQEYSLFDMKDGNQSTSTTMINTTIDQIVSTTQPHLLYIYDFLSMWTILIECVDQIAPTDGVRYPQIVYAIGEIPDSPPVKEFEADPRFADDLDTGLDQDNDAMDDDYYDQQDFDDYDLY